MDNSKKGQQAYQKLVKQISPPSPVGKNCLRAFVSGGLICVLGQGITNFARQQGASPDNAGLLTTIVLIGLAAILTGLGLYSRLGRVCGAGTIVPVTGFANSMVSPAIEFKKEGWVFGLGAKMFVLAGPVIVYGTLTAFVVGLVFWLTGGAAG